MANFCRNEYDVTLLVCWLIVLYANVLPPLPDSRDKDVMLSLQLPQMANFLFLACIGAELTLGGK